MDTRSLTYRELADALGVKIDSARKTVQRRRWAKTSGNDGTVRVIVPIEYLDRPKDRPTDSPVTIYTRELEVRIEGLQALVATETRRADTAEGLLALMRDQFDDVKEQRAGWQKQAEAAQKLLVDARPKRGWFGWRKAG